MEKLMTTIMRWLKLTCQDTSPLISEMLDHQVSFFKRLRIRIHLALCGVCLYYKGQLETIRALSKNLSREDFPVKKDATLSQKSKDKIKKMIEARH